MATRHLIKIRGLARRGDAAAQVELARLYLSGTPGLTPSISAALIWLERAARQGHAGACELIGKRIPLEAALAHGDPAFLLNCYQAAAAAGCTTANQTLAQWLLDTSPAPERVGALAQAAAWARQAADRGDADAAALLVRAFAAGHLPPLYREEPAHYQRLAATADQPHAAPADFTTILTLLHKPELSTSEARALLQYYLQALHGQGPDADAVHALHRAAQAGIADAQFHYGLWLGKFDAEGQRVKLTRALGVPKVGPALSWLRQAAEQHHGDAWFVLAMLHRNARYACHDQAQYLYCLHRATRLGCTRAQTYLGRKLWRNRRAGLDQLTEAAYWLWRAAQAGDPEAQALLPKAIGHAPATSPWHPLLHYLDTFRKHAISEHLGVRLRLAAAFGLNTAEMLWLDPHDAQREHCLVVDISARHATHAPRLIAIETVEQQARLDHFVTLPSAQPMAHGPDGQLAEELAALLAAARRDGMPLTLPDPVTPHGLIDVSPDQRGR